MNKQELRSQKERGTKRKLNKTGVCPAFFFSSLLFLENDLKIICVVHACMCVCETVVIYYCHLRFFLFAEISDLSKWLSERRYLK